MKSVFIFTFLFSGVLFGTIEGCGWRAPPQPAATTTTTLKANMYDTCGNAPVGNLKMKSDLEMIGTPGQQKTFSSSFQCDGAQTITCYKFSDTMASMGKAANIKITSGGVGSNQMGYTLTSPVGEGYFVSLSMYCK